MAPMTPYEKMLDNFARLLVRYEGSHELLKEKAREFLRDNDLYVVDPALIAKVKEAREVIEGARGVGDPSHWWAEEEADVHCAEEDLTNYVIEQFDARYY